MTFECRHKGGEEKCYLNEDTVTQGSSTCQDPGAGVWSGAQELKGATNDCGGRARGAEAGTGDSEQGGGVTGNVHVFCRLRTVTSE